jgi:hypothetical protein
VNDGPVHNGYGLGFFITILERDESKGKIILYGTKFRIVTKK